MSWTAILVLAGGAYCFKLLGVLFGAQFTSPLLRQAITLLPPALFMSVIVLQTFERAGSLVVDARVVGVLVAVIATWRRLPFIAILVLATAATAITRLVVG